MGEVGHIIPRLKCVPTINVTALSSPRLASSRLLFELILGDALAHGAGGADAAGDHLLQVVDVIRAAPLLVADDVDAELHLGLLDELAVGAHALGGVGAGEAVRGEGGGVQPREGDELPAVAQGGEAADVRLLLVAGHGGLPVEGGGEVVREPVRVWSVYPYSCSKGKMMMMMMMTICVYGG